MKWLFIMFFVVVGWAGYVQHTYNEEGVKQAAAELFQENDFQGIQITGINLPLSYTFLAEKVDAELFLKAQNKYESVKISITPIESFPIVSVFDAPAFHLSLGALDAFGLDLRLKN